MTSYKILLTVCLFLLFITLDARAACDSTGCSSKISRIYVSGIPGVVFIQPDEASLSALNCTPAEGLFLSLYRSHPNYTELYAAASLALALNKSVRLRIVESTDDCRLSYIMIFN